MPAQNLEPSASPTVSSLTAMTKSTLFAPTTPTVSVPSTGPGGGTVLGPNALPGGSGPPGVTVLGPNALPNNAVVVPYGSSSQQVSAPTTTLLNIAGQQYAIPNNPTAQALASTSLTPFAVSSFNPNPTTGTFNAAQPGASSYYSNANNAGGDTILSTTQNGKTVYYFASAPGVYFTSNPLTGGLANTGGVAGAASQTLAPSLPNYVSPFQATKAAQAVANASNQQTLASTSNVDFSSFGNTVANNLTFTSPTTFTGEYYANGLTYDFTGSIPPNLAVANTQYNTNASQQAKSAAIDAAYSYLTSLQGLGALPSGSRLTVNLDSQAAPSVNEPTQVISSGQSGPAQTTTVTVPTAVYVPDSTTAAAGIASIYGLQNPPTPNTVIIVTPSGFDPAASVSNAQQYANAVAGSINLINTYNLKPPKNSQTINTQTGPNIPDWYQVLMNAAPSTGSGVYMANLAALQYAPDLVVQQSPSSSILKTVSLVPGAASLVQGVNNFLGDYLPGLNGKYGLPNPQFTGGLLVPQYEPGTPAFNTGLANAYLASPAGQALVANAEQSTGGLLGQLGLSSPEQTTQSQTNIQLSPNSQRPTPPSLSFGTLPESIINSLPSDVNNYLSNSSTVKYLNSPRTQLQQLQQASINAYINNLAKSGNYGNTDLDLLGQYFQALVQSGPQNIAAGANQFSNEVNQYLTGNSGKQYIPFNPVGAQPTAALERLPNTVSSLVNSQIPSTVNLVDVPAYFTRGQALAPLGGPGTPGYNYGVVENYLYGNGIQKPYTVSLSSGPLKQGLSLLTNAITLPASAIGGLMDPTTAPAKYALDAASLASLGINPTAATEAGIAYGAEGGILNELLNNGQNQQQSVLDAQQFGTAAGPLYDLAGPNAVRNSLLFGGLPSGALGAVFGLRGQALENAILAGQAGAATTGAFENVVGPALNSITGRAATDAATELSNADVANLNPKNPTYLANALTSALKLAPQGAVFGGSTQAFQNLLDNKPIRQNVALSAGVGGLLGGGIGAILPFLPSAGIENIEAARKILNPDYTPGTSVTFGDTPLGQLSDLQKAIGTKVTELGGYGEGSTVIKAQLPDGSFTRELGDMDTGFSVKTGLVDKATEVLQTVKDIYSANGQNPDSLELTEGKGIPGTSGTQYHIFDSDTGQIIADVNYDPVRPPTVNIDGIEMKDYRAVLKDKFDIIDRSPNPDKVIKAIRDADEIKAAEDQYGIASNSRITNPNIDESPSQYFKGLSIGNQAIGLSKTIPEDVANNVRQAIAEGAIKESDSQALIDQLMEGRSYVRQLVLPGEHNLLGPNGLNLVTPEPKFNYIEGIAGKPADISLNNLESATVRSQFQRNVILNGIEDLAVKVGDDTPEGAHLAELSDSYKNVFAAADKFSTIFTALTSQTVNNENAGQTVNFIKNELGVGYDALSIADKNAAIVQADPTITNGRIWINTLTPDQNIAFNDMIRNQWDARIYGTASVRYQLADQFRLGGDADIFLAGKNDEDGALLANKITDVLNNADPTNPLKINELTIVNSANQNAVDIHPEFSEITEPAPANPLGARLNEPLVTRALGYSVDPTGNTFLGKLNSVLTLRTLDDGSLYIAPADYRIKDVVDAAAIAQRLYEQLNPVAQATNAATLTELQSNLESIYNSAEKPAEALPWAGALKNSLNEPIEATAVAGAGPAVVNPISTVQGAVVSSAFSSLTPGQSTELLDKIASSPSQATSSVLGRFGSPSKPISRSLSPSLSPSVSPSVSPSPSLSPSLSPSVSPSPSSSTSPSKSPSISRSVSLSPSVSPSISPSPSVSPSVSPSPSTSPSPSPYPSPSNPYKKIVLPLPTLFGESPQSTSSVKSPESFQNIYSPSLLPFLFPNAEKIAEETYSPLTATSGLRPIKAPAGAAPLTLSSVAKPSSETITTSTVPGVENPNTAQASVGTPVTINPEPGTVAFNTGLANAYLNSAVGKAAIAKAQPSGGIIGDLSSIVQNFGSGTGAGPISTAPSTFGSSAPSGATTGLVVDPSTMTLVATPGTVAGPQLMLPPGTSAPTSPFQQAEINQIASAISAAQPSTTPTTSLAQGKAMTQAITKTATPGPLTLSSVAQPTAGPLQTTPMFSSIGGGQSLVPSGSILLSGLGATKLIGLLNQIDPQSFNSLTGQNSLNNLSLSDAEEIMNMLPVQERANIYLLMGLPGIDTYGAALSLAQGGLLGIGAPTESATGNERRKEIIATAQREPISVMP